MKNSIIFVIFCLSLLMFGCGDGGNSGKTAENGNDSGREIGSLYGECYGNGTCNEGLVCEIEDNVCVRDSNNLGHNDDLDSTSEQSDGDNDADATQGSSDSATDNNTDGSDTSVSDNDTDMDTDSGDSTPDSNTDTDTTPTSRCDPNPCLNVANSTKECIETGDMTYSCKCESGYTWNGSQCRSNSTLSLPECSPTSATPCIDSSSGLIWSAKADSSKDWSNANSYCYSHAEGGYTGWHLPTIDELRTLIKNCPDAEMPNGDCGVKGSCLSSYCIDSSCGCSPDSTGKYSKFGETGYFWSSSDRYDDSNYAWSVDFDLGGVLYNRKINHLNVRCVRSEYDGDEPVLDDSDSGIVPDDADTMPDNSDSTPDEDVDTIDPTEPSTPCNPNPCLNVANSTKECIEVGDTTYSCKCESGYNWSGSQCKSNSTPSLPECSTSNTGPCYDSTSHLMWSEKTTSTWQGAVYHCTNLNSSNYGGYSSGWRLPTISELRTLIKNCSGTQMPGGSCGVIDTGNSSTSCLVSSCWTEETCYSCSYDSTGGHSKFGDISWFWSSSIRSDSPSYAWIVCFSDGRVYGDDIGYLDHGNYVRCVRNSD